MILPHLDPGRRYVEVFAGAGAVFLNHPAKEALICDANPDLIALYEVLRDYGTDFIEYCRLLFNPDYNTRTAYYGLRDQFNTSRDKFFKAGTFVYLNRHSYNGLVRYNSRGEFNVPFGAYARPYFPAEEMKAFLVRLNSAQVRLAVMDFRKTFEEVQEGDQVYCDPPYVPASKTANFTQYTANRFAMPDQMALAGLVKMAAQKGAKVILSNSDNREVRTLYSFGEVVSHSTQRNLAAEPSKRGMAKEVLIKIGSPSAPDSIA